MWASSKAMHETVISLSNALNIAVPIDMLRNASGWAYTNEYFPSVISSKDTLTTLSPLAGIPDARPKMFPPLTFPPF